MSTASNAKPDISKIQSLIHTLTCLLQEVPPAERSAFEADLIQLRSFSEILPYSPHSLEILPSDTPYQQILDIVESINDGFFAFDREWRYIYINHRAAEPLGYRPEELIGKCLWDVFPKMRGTVAETHYRKAMEEGIPSQYRIQGIYSLRWFDISVYPSKNGISVFSIDRTEEVEAEQALRKSEEALRQSERRFRIALANAAIAVFSTDCDLRYNWFYSESMGALQNLFLGKRDDEILDPEDGKRILEIKQKALAEKIALRGEVKFLVNGQSKTMVLSVEPYLDQDGNPIGVIGSFYDVTQQRKLEAENIEHITQEEVQHRLLEYRERERQEIARDLHDGPVQDLSSLLFNIQFTREIINDSRVQVELEQIGLGLRSAIRDLRGMVNELRPPSLIRFGLAKAMRFHLEDFQEKHPDVHIELDSGDDMQRLPEQARLSLFRILQEAVNNAANHAHATRVQVMFHCTDQEAALEIKDNGQGFAVSPNLVDYTMKGHFGLVGMKERAEALGGDFQIMSFLGQGTTIKVSVPLKT